MTNITFEIKNATDLLKKINTILSLIGNENIEKLADFSKIEGGRLFFRGKNIKYSYPIWKSETSDDFCYDDKIIGERGNYKSDSYFTIDAEFSFRDSNYFEIETDKILLHFSGSEAFVSPKELKNSKITLRIQ